MFFLIQAVVQEPLEIPVLCPICKSIVKAVETYVEDPTNVAAVEAFLEQVCTILPFDSFKWCEQIIEKYYEELIDAIVKGYPPEVACAATVC